VNKKPGNAKRFPGFSIGSRKSLPDPLLTSGKSRNIMAANGKGEKV